MVAHDPHCDQDGACAPNGESVVDPLTLDFEVEVSHQSTDSHLPEATDREVKGELRVDVHTHNGNNEGECSVKGEDVESLLLEEVETYRKEAGPENVKLFLNSQRPQMQQRVGLYVCVEVAFLVDQDLEVGSENC